MKATRQLLDALGLPPDKTARKTARGSTKPGVMNKTEARYCEVLKNRQLAGEVAWFAYEALTFKLAPDTRYTPDFAVMLADGVLECHEVKGGFIREDAHLKIKIAAEKFPLRFIRATQKRVNDPWEFREF